MSQPPRIKRSASEQLSESPNKRVDHRGNLTRDRVQHRDRFGTESKLIPVVRRASQAETAEFEDYSNDMDNTQDIVNRGEESDDEFVDAEEDFIQGGIIQWAGAGEEVTAAQTAHKVIGIKDATASSPIKEIMEIEGFGDTQRDDRSEALIAANGKETVEEMLEEYKSATTPRFKVTNKAQEIQTETIPPDCDSEDHPSGNDKKSNSDHSSHDFEDETKQEPQEIISIEDEDNDPFDDMFAATFRAGKAKAKAQAEKETTSDSSNSGFTSGPGKKFTSGIHATTLRSGSTGSHTSTPPGTPPPTTTNATTNLSRPILPPRRRPDIHRDLSASLIRHSKFHNRAQLLIPRLPNHENFEWTRRYWISVLISGKRLTKTTSEKDFVWMKGNRMSTVATVFHTYCLAVMADPDDTVLVLGDESVEMEDQMQELDYFNDRLVVFKAVSKTLRGESDGMDLVKRVVPESEIVSLDVD